MISSSEKNHVQFYIKKSMYVQFLIKKNALETPILKLAELKQIRRFLTQKHPKIIQNNCHKKIYQKITKKIVWKYSKNHPKIVWKSSKKVFNWHKWTAEDLFWMHTRSSASPSNAQCVEFEGPRRFRGPQKSEKFNFLKCTNKSIDHKFKSFAIDWPQISI